MLALGWIGLGYGTVCMDGFDWAGHSLQGRELFIGHDNLMVITMNVCLEQDM